MIETSRLLIHPLTYSQLGKYIRNDFSLEEELNLAPCLRDIPPELEEALEQTILPNVADTGKDYLYSTIWTIIDKGQNKMVGDLCFVGEPNEKGEIEIGYGIYPESRNKGYMSEAVAAMIGWVRNQPCVSSIVADTEKDNPASFSVLLKNGFQKTGETENLFHWKLEVSK